MIYAQTGKVAGSSLVRSFFLSAWFARSFFPSLQNSESESARSIFVVHRRRPTSSPCPEKQRYISSEEKWGRGREGEGEAGRGERKKEKEYGDFLPSWEINAASSSSKFEEREKERARELLFRPKQDLLRLLRVRDGIAHIHLHRVSMSRSARTPKMPKEVCVYGVPNGRRSWGSRFACIRWWNIAASTNHSKLEQRRRRRNLLFVELARTEQTLHCSPLLGQGSPPVQFP